MWWIFCCGTKSVTNFEVRALAAIRELETQKQTMLTHSERFEVHSNELKKQALAASRSNCITLAKLKVHEWRRNQANAELYHRACKRIDKRIAQVQKLMAVDDELKSGEASIAKLRALGVAVKEVEEVPRNLEDANTSDEEEGGGGGKTRLLSPLTQTDRFDLVRKNLEEFSLTVDTIEKNGNILDSSGDDSPSDEMDLILAWERGMDVDLYQKNKDLSPKQVLMSPDSDASS